MSNLKRLAIVLVVLGIVALASASFKGSEVLNRAIIIGLGVDGTEEDIVVTAEVVSPGNGSEQVGTFSKTVTATGNSIAQAIEQVAEQTGKEASLGQCLILILGEDFYTSQDSSDIIDYFMKSDSFRESAIVCCCKGSANDVLNKGEALSQSVSLSLVTMLLDQAEKVGIPTNNLLKYARSQRELAQTGFLNCVQFVPSENKDSANPDKEQGYFLYRTAAVFRNNKYVCSLTEQEVKGFALFQNDVVGENFISNASGKRLTLNVNNKSVDNKYKDNAISIKITLSVNLARTDSADESGAFSYKEKHDIPDESLRDATDQATELAQAFLNKQSENNFDLINLHETIRQQKGTTKELCETETKDIEVKLEIKTEIQ